MSTTGRRVALIQIHIVVALAGGSGLFAKLVTASPALMTCARAAIAALCLGLVAAITKSSLHLADKRQLAVLALSGAILGFHWFSFFHSIRISTVAMGVLGFATFPLFVTFLEPLVFRERLRLADVLGSLVIVAGLVLVTPDFSLSSGMTRGLLWGVASGFAYALVSLFTRAGVKDCPVLAVTFYQQIFAALVLIPAILPWQGNLPPRDLFLLALLGIVFTALSQGLLVASLRHLSARTISIMLGMEPVYGILLAWFILHEAPSPRTLAGGLLICGMVFLTSIRHASPTKA